MCVGNGFFVCFRGISGLFLACTALLMADGAPWSKWEDVIVTGHGVAVWCLVLYSGSAGEVGGLGKCSAGHCVYFGFLFHCKM